MTRSEAQAAVRKYGGQNKACKALGIARGALQYALYESKHTGSDPAPVKSSVKSLNEFKQTFDKSFIVPNKIKAQLKKMGAGWMYEVDFAREAGITLTDVGHYRDKYAEAHVVELRGGRKAWAGKKSVTIQMREMI